MKRAGRRSFTAAKRLNPYTPGSGIKRLCRKFASLVRPRLADGCTR
jgi:hypothetical protein